MNKPRKTSPFQLLVEGQDDQWVVINLLQRNGYNFEDASAGRLIDAGMPHVLAHDGVDDLLRNIGLMIKGGYHCIGVILDADHPPYNRWAQLKTVVSGTAIALPARPVVGGIVLPGPPRFGVWVMPDNVGEGMLEDFLVGMVPEQDRIWQHAVDATRRARELGAPLKEIHVTKGAMHAWLSWQDPSGHPLGRALEYGTLRHDTSEALRFVAWFSDLFQVRPTRKI